MKKTPFSYEAAVSAATISNQIEGYEVTTDEKILREANRLVKKILKTSALENQLPDDDTVKIITERTVDAIKANT